jgi:hypothetical protein
MKTCLTASFAALLLLGTAGPSDAAYVLWTFGSGAFTTTATDSTFAGTPTFTRNGSATGGTFHGTGTAYTNPISGTTYTAGFAAYWNGTEATQNNGFTLSLNTVDLSDLEFRMDFRSAESGSGSRATAFSAVSYSLDNGNSYTPISGIPAWGISDNNFNSYSFNLASLDAIENKSSVLLKFDIPNQNSPGASANLRLDNLLVTAVPEPSSFLALAAGGLVLLRRRR